MTDSTARRSPVFIVGMPRSGTTLLSTMLDAHPELAISPETHFYTRCRSEEGAATDTVEEVWRRLQQQPGFQDMALSEAETERMWGRLDRLEDPSAVLRALCTTYAERDDARRWGEKTPDHLRYVPTILEEFPEAMVLCIIRDPRDVCLSLRDMPWNRQSLPESAYKWRQYARLTNQFKRTYPDRFRDVHYETLLDHPECALKRLLKWLRLPFDPAVLSFHERGSGPVDSGREPWKQKTEEPIDAGNKEKWRDQMGPAEQGIVQGLTEPYLSRHEYPVSPVAIDAEFWADALRVVLRAGRTIAGRVVGRWQTPDRAPDDYRPEWIRRQGDGTQT